MRGSIARWAPVLSRCAVSARSAALATTRDFLDALTDRRCPGCAGEVGREELVCTACDGLVGRLGTTLCLHCLHEGPPDAPGTSASEGAAAPAGGCARHGSNRLLLAGPAYEAPLDAIVRAFKYEGQSGLAPWIASLVPSIVPLGRDVLREAVLVPVPLHPARRAQRGFDQARLIANELGRWWGIPVVGLLDRVRDTPAQARLDSATRRSSVGGAFRLAAGHAALGGGRPLFLVDDVATTGSTLLAAAEALADCEPGLVIGLAAAHGGAPDEAPSPSQSTAQAKVAAPGGL